MSGIITQAKEKRDIQAQKPTAGTLMQRVITGGLKDQFEKMLGNKASGFISSLIDLYASDAYLQECDPAKVALEAMKSATLDLPINKQLGYAYIIPYKSTPTFILGYKGRIQLALRTGVYKHINTGIVYEGMEVTRDILSGDLKITGEPSSSDVKGYFAYLETLNGFSHAEYWTIDRVRQHAQKHSKSYKPSSGIWHDHLDAMAQKTVLTSLLSRWGIASIYVHYDVDEQMTQIADNVITQESANEPINNIDFEVNEETGELVEKQ